jgi:hypothetical protein
VTLLYPDNVKCPMNLIKYRILVAWCIIACYKGDAQGFVNFDFEDANLSGYAPGPVPASDAIPGWTAYIGTTVQADIRYDSGSLGAPALWISDVNALNGLYSMYLYGGGQPNQDGIGVSISQTAVVPFYAVSLRFIALPPNPLAGGQLLISLGGQNMPFSALSTGPNYTTYGGNIPLGLAGHLEQLMFSAPQGGNNYWKIDDIQFSPQSIPEPGMPGLLALAALLFRWRRSGPVTGASLRQTLIPSKTAPHTI